MSDLVIWGNVAQLCGGVFLSGNWTILNLSFQKTHFKKLPPAFSVGLYGINQLLLKQKRWKLPLDFSFDQNRKLLSARTQQQSRHG